MPRHSAWTAHPADGRAVLERADAVTRADFRTWCQLWAQDNQKKRVLTHDVDEAMLLASRFIVLGQSPSSIIYECAIPEDGRPTRETQFENMEMPGCTRIDFARLTG